MMCEHDVGMNRDAISWSFGGALFVDEDRQKRRVNT
jgi:hypothetical protein